MNTAKMLVWAALVAASPACGGATRREGGAALAPAGVQAARRIDIAVTEKGFEPDGIQVAKGETATIVFTRRTEHTCAKEVVLYLSDSQTVQRDLPLDQPVALTVTFSQSGELGYACGMSMHGGVIRVR